MVFEIGDLENHPSAVLTILQLRLRLRREGKDEADAAAGGVFGPEAAAVRLGDAAADREAKAGAGDAARGAAPVELVEDPLRLVRHQALAVVPHADPHLPEPHAGAD